VVDLLFYVMALGAILSAIGVVAARSPVTSVLSLLGSFFCVAVIYLLAGFAFLAAVQILVYAGAIMVLFLFVVMLLNLGNPDSQESEPIFDGAHKKRTAVIAFGVAGAMLFALLAAVQGSDLSPVSTTLAALEGKQLDPLKGMAEQMFTRYALPFEAASVLLLATVVGVLVLAKRNRGKGPGTEAAS